MRITGIVIIPVRNNEKGLKAYVKMEIDDCFIVRDIKVVKGPGGYIVAMPAKKMKDGSFRDIAHPINKGARQMIESAVMDEYFKAAEEAKHRSSPAGHRYSAEA